MTSGILLLAVIGSILLSYSQFFAVGGASTSTPASATSIPTFVTPTALPIETATPTESPVPTLTATMISTGPGGADSIAFTANNDIYLINSDGTNILQLTNTNLVKFDLQWLPNGNELLYGENSCAYKIDITLSPLKSEVVACV